MLSSLRHLIHMALRKWKCCKCGSHHEFTRDSCTCGHKRCSGCAASYGW
ncbi:MAG: hypothetical protein IPK22_07005 [Verrucomicrobiaceae bacterium]|nr:hypothetical protein [Verrucomicrobiaceae bacterium]